MRTKISCIYKITCLSNNKIYIGQTTDYVNRINHHKNKLKRNCDDNPYLQEDYNKYGSQNFKYEIIEKCTKESLLIRETYWINHYGGKNNSSLYNMQDLEGFNNEYCISRQGSNNVMYHKTHSIKVRHLLSDINKGKILSKEHKNNISKGLKLSNCHSEENNQKRRIALTNYNEDFIQKLRDEYILNPNYRYLSRRYKISECSIRNLILYGTTSRIVINKIKNNSCM